MSETRPLAADQLLAHLLDAGVDFIVIGAFAVAAHGAPRATTDLDITPEPSADNLERLMRALDAIDARMLPLDIPEHGEILSVEWLAEGGNFQFSTAFGQLDVLQVIVGPDLEHHDLAAHALQTEVLGMQLEVCSYDDLVKMKESAGRTQDMLDLERLRTAREQPG